MTEAKQKLSVLVGSKWQSPQLRLECTVESILDVGTAVLSWIDNYGRKATTLDSIGAIRTLYTLISNPPAFVPEPGDLVEVAEIAPFDASPKHTVGQQIELPETLNEYCGFAVRECGAIGVQPEERKTWLLFGPNRCRTYCRVRLLKSKAELAQERAEAAATPIHYQVQQGDWVRVTELDPEPLHDDQLPAVGELVKAKGYPVSGKQKKRGYVSLTGTTEAGKEIDCWIKCEPAKEPHPFKVGTTWTNGLFFHEVIAVDEESEIATTEVIGSPSGDGRYIGQVERNSIATLRRRLTPWQRPRAPFERITAAVAELGPNAQELLADIADRLVMGTPNGDFEAAKNWSKEAYEEDLDAVIYRTLALKSRKGA